MNVHPAPRPGLHPTKPVVRESDSRFNVVTTDPAASEEAINFPQDDAAENDAKENQERDIDWYEESCAEPLQEICLRAGGSHNKRRSGLHFLCWNCLHPTSNMITRCSGFT